MQTLIRRLWGKPLEDRKNELHQKISDTLGKLEEVRDAAIKANKVREKVLAISSAEYSELNGKLITDYETIGIRATGKVIPFKGLSVATYKGISVDVCLASLSEEMERLGVEAVVSARCEITPLGLAALLNPHAIQTTIYGTGMRLKYT